MITLKQIRNIQTFEDLELLGIGRIDYDISYRGGYLGFYNTSIAETFNINPNLLPGKFGAYCNYLGGGIRGTVNASDYSDKITGRKAKLLDELGLACVRVYENIENESYLNETEDEDGETNWDALATEAARNRGICSAY